MREVFCGRCSRSTSSISSSLLRRSRSLRPSHKGISEIRLAQGRGDCRNSAFQTCTFFTGDDFPEGDPALLVAMAHSVSAYGSRMAGGGPGNLRRGRAAGLRTCAVHQVDGRRGAHGKAAARLPDRAPILESMHNPPLTFRSLETGEVDPGKNQWLIGTGPFPSW